jgi:hypothetical protein
VRSDKSQPNNESQEKSEAEYNTKQKLLAASRSGGRGGNAARTWVRSDKSQPNNESQEKSEGVDNTKQENLAASRSGGRGGITARTWVRSDKSQPNNESQEKSEAEYNTKQKLLAASRSGGRGGNTARTWVRSDKSQSNNESQEKSEGVDNTKQELLMRRGRNQLIMKPPSTTQRLTAANTASPVTMLPASMKRQGRNRLVTSLTTVQMTNEKDAPAKQQDVEKEKNTKHRSTDQQGIPDTAVVPNKLSFPQSNKHAIRTPGHRKKRPPPWAAERSGAKRIAINTSMMDNKDGQLSENHDHDDKDEKPPPQSQAEEKLTDFAYRETSKVARRVPVESKNRKWSLAQGSTASTAISQPKPSTRLNMGLVRVQPNTRKTPICTIFLKGIQCTDKYCNKRHDVPKEFALPVCSFFQRHGQCLKGDDCMFRHVKVNPRAMVCPSFALLGFCEDQGCKMKHEQNRPSTSNKRK